MLPLPGVEHCANRGATLRESTAKAKSTPPPPPQGYWQRSESPLASLAFVLPMIVAYEVGTHGNAQNPIVAFTKIQQFFRTVYGLWTSLVDAGRGGTPHPHPPLAVMFLPAAAVVAILLADHILRRHPWRIVWGDLLKMVIESAVLAVPLLILWFAVAPYLARLPLMASPETVTSLAVPCIGAGVYEELIFRLIVFSLLGFLLGDVLRMPKPWVYGITICLSAMGFSAYHYLGYEQFSPITFVFRCIAGLYFSAVYLCRGFGVTCGSHASYDVIVVCLQHIH